jgi:hypothetical protein
MEIGIQQVPNYFDILVWDFSCGMTPVSFRFYLFTNALRQLPSFLLFSRFFSLLALSLAAFFVPLIPQPPYFVGFHKVPEG